uniref:EGF-like domain-containing protein n=1 Tax=Panagrellus redivivus TaxID=6233 RepID=A0A7E4V1W8_PANRE
MRLLWTVLFFALGNCVSAEVLPAEQTKSPIPVLATLKSLPITACENGVLKNGICECPYDYTGKFCEHKVNCVGPHRLDNGSCAKCQKGYTGPLCNVIVCQKGERNPDETCNCTKPYSGKFCDVLDTKDVYLHYNRKIYQFGPVGAFIIIPMVLAMFACSHTSKKRQVKRAEFAYEHQNTNDVNKHSITDTEPITTPLTQ